MSHDRENEIAHGKSVDETCAEKENGCEDENGEGTSVVLATLVGSPDSWMGMENHDKMHPASLGVCLAAIPLKCLDRESSCRNTATLPTDADALDEVGTGYAHEFPARRDGRGAEFLQWWDDSLTRQPRSRF